MSARLLVGLHALGPVASPQAADDRTIIIEAGAHAARLTTDPGRQNGAYLTADHPNGSFKPFGGRDQVRR